MGCATSKIENDEVVGQCNTRKRHVKDAVSARHTFAAAFSNYVIALRTIGSAFSQFGEAEFRDPVSPTTATANTGTSSSSSSATHFATSTPLKTPKPPPLPNFYNSTPSNINTATVMPPVMDPLKRSVSLPPLNLEHKTKTSSPLKNNQKVNRNMNKKKMKPSPSPSPEPEEVEEKKKVLDEVDEKKVEEDLKDKKNAKVTSEDDEEEDASWVPAQRPPPPVPSSKPPPPMPAPPRSTWGFVPDLFEFSSVPLPSPRIEEIVDEDEDFDWKKKKQQEEDEKRKKQIEQEQREAQKRKEEEERRARHELELKQKQEEQVKRRPSTVAEVDDEEEEEDVEEDDEEEEEGEEEDEGDEEEDEGEDEEDEEEEEGASKQEEEEDKSGVENVVVEEATPKKSVNYDLPKTDLVIVTNTKDSKSREELVTVLKKIDEHFQVAYESGRDVAVMLEAHRVSFHPNFIDSRSDETHAKKVLRAISWSNSSSVKADLRSEPLQQLPDEDGMPGTHAATLDRLLAWEKKLFDEVKRAELIRVELDKKNAWILKEEGKGGNPEAIERAKTAVKSLQTRFMVALQGVDTARNSVLRLRDSELYPQLLELLKGIYQMWKTTHECHAKQYDEVMAMKKLDVLDVVESTSNLHKVATEQLKVALNRWYTYFGSVVSSQRDYMYRLHLYVKVSVKSLELGKDGVSTGSQRFPIKDLCQEWLQALDRLPDKRALEAINTFVQELETIVEIQKQESRHRKKVETLEIEVKNKEAYVARYEKKHLKSNSVSVSEAEETSEMVPVERTVVPGPLTEKKAQLEVLKRRLEEEKEKVEELERSSKNKTINSLQMGLPNIFYAVKAISKQCYDVHHGLQEFANTSLLTDK